MTPRHKVPLLPPGDTLEKVEPPERYRLPCLAGGGYRRATDGPRHTNGPSSSWSKCCSRCSRRICDPGCRRASSWLPDVWHILCTESLVAIGACVGLATEAALKGTEVTDARSCDLVCHPRHNLWILGVWPRCCHRVGGREGFVLGVDRVAGYFLFQLARPRTWTTA